MLAEYEVMKRKRDGFLAEELREIYPDCRRTNIVDLFIRIAAQGKGAVRAASGSAGWRDGASGVGRADARGI